VYADGCYRKSLSCGARCWIETHSEVTPIILLETSNATE
jgi:hypothetical protein